LGDAERVYYQPDVAHTIQYDATAQTFTVALKGVIGRLGAQSDQRYLTSRPLTVPRGRTATEGLVDATKPFGHFTVPAGSLASPQHFERSLHIEALVRPKALHQPVADNPARISSLEVDVVGLRAYLPDLSWGTVVIRPPDAIPNYRCPPLDPAAP
jgi:hypothetical protein